LPPAGPDPGDSHRPPPMRLADVLGNPRDRRGPAAAGWIGGAPRRAARTSRRDPVDAVLSGSRLQRRSDELLGSERPVRGNDARRDGVPRRARNSDGEARGVSVRRHLQPASRPLPQRLRRLWNVVTAGSRPVPQPRHARSLAIGALTGLLLSTIACDRWKAPFRAANAQTGLRATVRTPLPPSAYRVLWEPHTVAAVMPRGSSADVRIAFTNVGDAVWPDVLAGDPATHSGGYAVRLAYGWTAASAPRSDMP